MKHFLLLFMAGGMGLVTHAQLNKGQWIVGGNAGFSYSDKHQTFPYVSASNKNSVLQFSPAAGYFVFDRFCVGIKPRAEWLHRTTKAIETTNGFTGEYNSNAKTAMLGIGPFARYYFLPKTNKINLVADASYAYSHEKATGHSEGPDFNSLLLPDNSIIEPLFGQNYNLHVFSFSVGPVIFLNGNTAIDLLVNYSYAASGDIAVSPNSFSIGAGFQIYLGK